MKTYQVHIFRIPFEFKDLVIKANSISDAIEKALSLQKDSDWSTSECMVELIN